MRRSARSEAVTDWPTEVLLFDQPLIQRSGLWEAIGDKIGRIAVHIGARVALAAERDEVFVSNTVKDLVVGSGTAFKDRGRADRSKTEFWRRTAVPLGEFAERALRLIRSRALVSA